MISLNEKCTIIKKTQNTDGYGSIAETDEIIGEIWCEIVSHEVFIKTVKGGKKRTEDIRIKVWLNNEITMNCDVIHNNIRYSILNAMHNRVRGITTIVATFNN
jgi:hypothetical protein